MARNWLNRWFGGGAERSDVREDAPRTTNGPGEVVEVPPTLIGLLERTSQLESQLTMVRLEWAEVLDKINAWANRQAARDRVALKRTLGQSDQPEDDERVEVEARSAANGVDESPDQLNGVHSPGRLSKIERYRLRNRR